MFLDNQLQVRDAGTTNNKCCCSISFLCWWKHSPKYSNLIKFSWFSPLHGLPFQVVKVTIRLSRRVRLESDRTPTPINHLMVVNSFETCSSFQLHLFFCSSRSFRGRHKYGSSSGTGLSRIPSKCWKIVSIRNLVSIRRKHFDRVPLRRGSQAYLWLSLVSQGMFAGANESFHVRVRLI